MTSSQPTWILFIEQNMFLAIINDTYSEVKEELASNNDDLHITDLFKQVRVAQFKKKKTTTHVFIEKHKINTMYTV